MGCCSYGSVGVGGAGLCDGDTYKRRLPCLLSRDVVASAAAGKGAVGSGPCSLAGSQADRPSRSVSIAIRRSGTSGCSSPDCLPVSYRTGADPERRPDLVVSGPEPSRASVAAVVSAWWPAWNQSYACCGLATYSGVRRARGRGEEVTWLTQRALLPHAVGEVRSRARAVAARRSESTAVSGPGWRRRRGAVRGSCTDRGRAR